MQKMIVTRAVRTAAKSHIAKAPSLLLCTEASRRSLHSSTKQSATALPITATGPPPSPPQPAASQYGEVVERKRRKAEMLRQGKELRETQSQTSSTGKASPLRKRFWKAVNVNLTPQGHYEVYLDTRPVRTPSKTILKIPASKPHLAHAIAIEWDMLESAAQALKNHNIPMTSIAARAQDILEQEAQGNMKTRNDITTTMMRYLDTDTLLCWAPEKSAAEEMGVDMSRESTDGSGKRETLRDLQMKTAVPIIAYLNTSVWPGVEITPVLDENSIFPRKQSEVTRSIVQGWIMGLPAFELAGLERAVLASKSLLIGTRLVIEWSEEFRDIQLAIAESESGAEKKRFGIEEAAKASQVEVKWQTGQWGEVEDTHDVDNEDIRMQLGTAVLLVSGNR